MGLNQDVLKAVEQLKKGDQEGFNILYSHTYNYVYSRARNSINDEQEALDLLQEVYVSAYKNIGSLKNVESLYAWLGSIAVRQGAKMASKKKSHVLLAEENEEMFEQVPDNELSVEEQIANEQDAQAIKECIAKLSAEQKTAVMAYYFDGLSVEEIAELSDVSAGTIKSRLFLARKYLKESITELEKKQGYTLHAFSTPTLILAIKLLLGDTKLSGDKAQEIYDSVCKQVGIPTTKITTGQSIIPESANIAGAEKVMGIMGKIIAVGKVKVVSLVIGAVAVASAGGYAVYANYNKPAETTAVAEEKKIEPPVIEVYGEKIVVGIDTEILLQDTVVKSISSEEGIEEVTISQKTGMTVTDITGGHGKNGVPAKTIKFTKEGTYVVNITATDTKGGKTTMTVNFEVGGELVGYVKGIKDWTVEVNAKNVDFMKDVTWDKEKVKGVTADSSKVNVKKEGKYDLIYTIKGIIVGQETSVTKKVDVKVISEKEAKKEADKGNVVVTSNGEVKKDSTGKVPTGDKVASSGGTASKPDNGGTTSKPDNGGTASKPDNGGTSNAPVEKPSEPSKPVEKPSEPSEPETPVHTHSWVDVTTVVNHPAEGHNEDYLISDAWTEGGDPIYEMVEVVRCSACNMDITYWSQSQVDSHLEQHVLNGENGGYYCGGESVQTGTTPIINHPAEYGTRWVVDKDAWSETVVTGQQCNGCDATK